MPPPLPILLSVRGIVGTARALARLFFIRGFRRNYEPPQHDPMLRATAADGLTLADDLRIAAAAGFLYTPVHPTRFQQALQSAEVAAEKYVFVDLGCGRGRALILAGEFGFKELVGIEISARLAREARAAVRKFARDPDRIRVIHGDARELEFPPEPLLVFLYNPFAAPVLAAVLRRLRASLARSPRPAHLLYFAPELDAMVEAAGFARRAAGDDWVLFSASPASAPAGAGAGDLERR